MMTLYRGRRRARWQWARPILVAVAVLAVVGLAALVWPHTTAPTPLGLLPTPSSPRPHATASPTLSPSAGPTSSPLETASLPAQPKPTAENLNPMPSTSSQLPVSPNLAVGDLTYTEVYLTGYWGGGDDNDCEGHGGDCTAHGDGHAGGSLTYEDPQTLAVYPGVLPVGQLVWIEGLGYAVVEDDCANCYTKTHHKPWIDLWVGMNEAAMDKITGDVRIVIDPPPGLPTHPEVIA